MPVSLNATITKRVPITDDLIILSIRPDSGVPDFEPGQYVALGLYGSADRPEHFPPEPSVIAPDRIVKRAYSIGSSPSHRSDLEFYIAVVPEGALTSRIVSLREGGRIFVASKITGTFTLKGVPPDANLVFVATGTGIAPYMSMLRSAETWTENRKIRLIHGVRYSKDLAYREEAEKLSAHKPNAFSYHSIVSRAEDSWVGHRGHVQKFFESDIIKTDPTKDHVFLCGNPGMVDGMESLLTLRGYTVHSKKNPDGMLHLERYW